MKVNVCSWFGQPLPLGLEKGEQEVSEEMVIKIFKEGYDVMLKHCRPERQTKKERNRDGQKPDGVPLLAIDTKYGGMRQR